MAFCKNCGFDIGDAKFCTQCGTPAYSAQKEETAQKADEATCATAEPETCNDQAKTVKEEPKKMGLNVKMLVWSIINTVLCCQILGIISLVFTILAAETFDRESAEKYLKTAKILNIVGIICIALYVLIMIAYIIFVILVGGLMSLELMSLM